MIVMINHGDEYGYDEDDADDGNDTHDNDAYDEYGVDDNCSKDCDDHGD